MSNSVKMPRPSARTAIKAPLPPRRCERHIMNLPAGLTEDSLLVAFESIVRSYLTPDEFKGAFRNHPAGVAVVTADAGDGPVALTVTSVFSVSAAPPLFVFSVSALSSSAPTIIRSASVVVHLLGADQVHLAKLCATSGIDRFADTSIWDRLDTGEPYFPSANAWIRGNVVNTLQAGSSTLMVVQGTQAKYPESTSAQAAAECARPLVYHDRTWHELGDHSKIK